MWRKSIFITILRVKKWKCVYEEPKNDEFGNFFDTFGVCVSLVCVEAICLDMSMQKVIIII